MTDLYEVMRCAPSTRYFTDEPVAKDVVERWLFRFGPGLLPQCEKFLMRE